MPKEYLFERGGEAPLRSLLDTIISDLGFSSVEQNEAQRRFTTSGIWAAAWFARELAAKIEAPERRCEESLEHHSTDSEWLDVMEIPRHPDLAGANAFVRNGLVKLVAGANGQAIVAKRGGAGAASRLNVEISNGKKLKRLIGSANPGGNPSGRRIKIEVSTPFRILETSDGNAIYALSDYVSGQTLEDALLYSSSDARKTFAADYVAIMFSLLDLDILWNDLSPRNILIRDAGEGHYTLIDFEKTSFSSHALTVQDRMSFIRGNCVAEELAIFLTAEELTEHLRTFFDFSAWDYVSTGDVLFQPRSDVMDLIRSLDLLPELGIYNRLDERLIRVRGVQRLANGRRFHPGRITTRLQHVLTSYPNEAPRDYDLRVNEILLSAPDMGTLSSCFDTLSDLVADLEVGIFARDIETFIRTGNANIGRLDESALTRTLSAIDALWHGLDRDRLRDKIVRCRDG